jgi:alpha-N-arabinofuranosidase
MANYAQTVNVIGCIKTTKTHADFDSTGLVLSLYRNQFGTVPVEISQAAPLDVSAALTADKKFLTIGIVNPRTNSIPVKLSFASAKPSGLAQVWSISGTDPLAFNQPGEKRRVDILQGAPADLNGSTSVPGLSITLWRAPVN